MIQTILILLVVSALTAGIDPLRKRLPDKRAVQLVWAAFAVYVLGNLYFTILSRIAGSGTHVDLRPFGSYLRMFESIEEDFVNVSGFAALFLSDISFLTGMLLNILLYYPLGYLLTILFPKLRAWQIILIGCAASLATELTQYFLRMGWCEMDDLLHNTLGTAVGLWVRRVQNRFLCKRK